MDDIQAWITECCSTELKEGVAAQAALGSFLAWAADRGVGHRRRYWLSPRLFADELVRRGHVVRWRGTVEGRQARLLRGLGLLAERRAEAWPDHGVEAGVQGPEAPGPEALGEVTAATAPTDMLSRMRSRLAKLKDMPKPPADRIRMIEATIA